MPAPPARGNIDYDQLQAAVRLGAGGLFQMAGASAVSGGNLPTYDGHSNLVDTGRQVSTIPYYGGVKHLSGNYTATPGDTGYLLVFASTAPALLSLPAPSGQSWTLQTSNSGPGGWLSNKYYA